ncbi:MAG TPA: hypothetical protein VID75_11670 [Acidimicrobiales bacterium]|jgi:hypothetical protein
MAHWNGEVERANTELLASLEDLRRKADQFIAVSALATTMFAIFTPGSGPNGSDRGPNGSDGDHGVAALSEEAPPATESPTPEGAIVSNLVPRHPTADDSAPYPDAEQLGIVRFRISTYDLSPFPEPVVARAITSPNTVIAAVGTPFSFTVTTTGTPVPSLATKGTPARCLTLVDNHDGTATISGTPDKTGVYRATIKARFGKDMHKYVVTQVFTLTVTHGAP